MTPRGQTGIMDRAGADKQVRLFTVMVIILATGVIFHLAGGRPKTGFDWFSSVTLVVAFVASAVGLMRSRRHQRRERRS